MTHAEADTFAQALAVTGFVSRGRLLGDGQVLVYWTPVDTSAPALEEPSAFRVPGSFAEAIVRQTGTGLEWRRLFVGRGAEGAGIFTACLRYAVGSSGDSTIAAGSPLAATVEQAGFDADDDGVLRINKSRVQSWLNAHGG